MVLVNVLFSSSDKVLASPKVPPKTIPCTPASSCALMLTSNMCKSKVSSFVNFVVTAGITPFQFILMVILFFMQSYKE